jgi:hypothetical protein
LLITAKAPIGLYATTAMRIAIGVLIAMTVYDYAHIFSAIGSNQTEYFPSCNTRNPPVWTEESRLLMQLLAIRHFGLIRH